MICNRCQKEHDGTFGSGKFCNKSCANARTHSIETKAKISASVKLNPSSFVIDKSLVGKNTKKPEKHKEVICPTCSKIFQTNIKWPSVFCSSPCVKRGGVRKGSGKSKTGWYKGFYCGSTYELAFLIYNLDQGINVSRYEGSLLYMFEGKEHNYYPDFQIDETIYEIKGYYDSKAFAKKQAYPNIVIIDKTSIGRYIKYVSETYNVRPNKLFSLYE